MAGYIFGGNTGLTYQDMLRQRQQAQQMQAGIDKVQGPGGGLNALAKGFAANILNRRANAVEKEGMEAVDAQWNQQFGGSALGQLFANRIGGGAPFADGGQAAAPQQSQPQFAPDGSIIRQGLVERGLPEHVADAFVLNFQDESGLNPGINEQNPVVPGSRGGFGLAQWTGPRRRQLEAFAAQRGTPVSDLNTQLDFLMTELQGPESRAAQSILSAQDTPTAAAAIVNNFLRPAEEHRARREAAYLGGQAGGHPAGQGGQPMGMDADMAQMAALMGNPFLDEGRRSVLGALMQQRMAQQNAVWEQQQAAQDPYRRAQLEQIQLQNEALRNPENASQALPAEIQALEWRARQAGLEPGSQEYQDFILNGGRTSGGDGPAAFQALHRQAIAAGFEPESDDYKQFMATRGAGLAAEARAIGAAAGESQASADSDYQTAQNALDLIESIRSDPALDRGTGKSSVFNAIPGTSGYDFNLKVEQAKGGAFLTAVQTMKGLGALSNNEGQAATAAITRMSTASTKEGFLSALDDYEKIVRQGLERAVAKGGGPAPLSSPQGDAQGGPPDFSAMSDDELADWIEKNGG